METEQEKLRAQGLEVETVADIIERDRTEGSPPHGGDAAPFVLARLEGSPEPFQSGIYFGLDEEVYHAAPALSYTGIKRLASSPMLYWATTPWLNADFEPPEEKDHFNLGHAYDCRIFDGREAFNERFALKLDRADYPDALVTSDDIKARIADLGLKPKGTTKAGWFDQLLEWEPDAQLWDRLVAEHAEANTDKTMISAMQYRRIEIAVAMIERDPEMAATISGGHSQVAFFWTCPKTGIPMKARPDYLKMRSIIDMKSLNNQRQRSIENAIRYEIADRKYNIQVSAYLEGAAEVRKLIRAHGESVIFPNLATEVGVPEEQAAWAQKWASNVAPDEWLFIFQQTGIAPVTRLVHYPRGGTTKAITDEIVSRMKRRYREMNDLYGTDPWLDLGDRIDLADEDIPGFATDI